MAETQQMDELQSNKVMSNSWDALSQRISCNVRRWCAGLMDVHCIVGALVLALFASQQQLTTASCESCSSSGIDAGSAESVLGACWLRSRTNGGCLSARGQHGLGAGIHAAVLTCRCCCNNGLSRPSSCSKVMLIGASICNFSRDQVTRWQLYG
jgi:hypothetical protein